MVAYDDLIDHECGNRLINVEYGTDESDRMVRATYAITTERTATVMVGPGGVDPEGETMWDDYDIAPCIEHARILYELYHSPNHDPPGPDGQGE